MSADVVNRIRRIAVALDASAQSERMLAVAAAIAAAMQAELEGVFVEDAVLLRATGLPFQREFRLTTRGETVPCAERLQRELRAEARRMRQALEQSALRRNCAWSFRVWRGDLEGEILSAASGAELFTLGLIGRFQPLRQRRQPAPANPAAALAIGVLFDGSEGAVRALAAAAELAHGGGAMLRIMLQGSDPEAIAHRREAATALLGDAASAAAFIALPERSAAAPARAVLRTGADVLLAGADNPLLQREILWQSLAALDCPLLVVR
jgi:hypothetical protein